MDFEPEIEGSLKQRYSDAVVDVYDCLEVSKNPESRPGNKRKHVFDFFDGCRLIVSKERFPDGKLMLHFSASFKDGYFSQKSSHQEILGIVVDKVQELRGEPFKGAVQCIMIKDVVHLMYEENQIVPLPGTNPMWN